MVFHGSWFVCLNMLEPQIRWKSTLPDPLEHQKTLGTNTFSHCPRLDWLDFCLTSMLKYYEINLNSWATLGCIHWDTLNFHPSKLKWIIASYEDVILVQNSVWFPGFLTGFPRNSHHFHRPIIGKNMNLPRLGRVALKHRVLWVSELHSFSNISRAKMKGAGGEWRCIHCGYRIIMCISYKWSIC